MSKLFHKATIIQLILLLCLVINNIKTAPTDNNYYVQNPNESSDTIEFSATLNFTVEHPFPPTAPSSHPNFSTLCSKRRLKFLEQLNNKQNTNSKEIIHQHNHKKDIDDIIPDQYQLLDLHYSLDTNEIHYVKITATNQKRWEVPKYILSDDYKRDIMKITNTTKLNNYFRYTHEPVALVFKNPKTREEFLSIGRTTLVYRNDYISFDYEFTSDFISGYGERAHNFKLSPGIYTNFANDTGSGSTYDDGLGGKNLYGQQPFMLHRTKMGTYVGVLFFNSNAQDLVINGVDKWNRTYAEQRTIGGVIELYTWTRDNPIDVIKVYHNLIGRPELPPFWALGWHQCKYGYKNETEWKEVVEMYKENNLPLDTMWLDIDYMEKYYDFTISTENFGNLTGIVKDFQNEGLHVVPILDIGIPNDPEDKYYKLGMELNTFIMSNYTGNPLINTVWPGKTHFPDFTNPNSKILWETGLKDFFKVLNYDGLWLDMNEPGMINSDPVGEQDAVIDPAKNMYSNLYYTPGNGYIHLERHTISLNALTYGDDKTISTIYNVKPLNPWNQNRISSNFIRNTLKKRPFVLSRSNFVGMGRYSHHWLGDNFSTWDSLRKSIPGVFNYQMFGFNLVGPDVCGFIGDTTDKLCSRWQTIGAFYPFARNHNNLASIDQHPYNVGPLTIEATRRTLNIRYSLIRYMYTEHFLSSKLGGVVFQPIFFQFPKEKEAIDHIDEQFMVGPSIMIAPVLKEETDDIDAYIPNANWNNLYNGSDLDIKSAFNYDSTRKTGQVVKLSGAYNHLNLFFRGGRILPLQFNSDKVRRTQELPTYKTTLIVNPDENLNAEGDLVFDDGEPNTIATEKYIHVNMKLIRDIITFNSLNRDISYANNDVYIDKIIILRVDLTQDYNKISIKDRFFEDINFVSSIDKDNKIVTISFPGDVRVDNLSIVYLNNLSK